MKKINFNDNWSFSFDGQESYSVDIPHDFSITQKRRADSPSGESGGFFMGGYGEYEKAFVAKKGIKYFIMCDGIFGLSEIFVNLNTAYINKYPYNSFFVDITDYLRYDKENVIKIMVNNNNIPNARWYTGAGIYRDIFLCECKESYLHPFGTFVYTKEICDDYAQMVADVSFFADKKGEGVIELEIFDGAKKRAVKKLDKYFCVNGGENTVSFRFELDNPKIWDTENPNMYSVKTKLKMGKITDTQEDFFGIRTVSAHSQRGFLLNGKSIKLRGGCVHHDHGPIGAKVYKEAEYRRIARLKEAGFNAVRCSHNPQSQYFYEACDRLGMLVIDELYDYWTEGKKRDDFHAFFEDNYEKWTDLIVRRNRCHPSIVMWSTGNEVPQKTGRGNGFIIASAIADQIRGLDPSRLLTHALCGLWDSPEEYAKERETFSCGSEELDYWAEHTRVTADTVDIVGYNYYEPRIERDLVRFPNRLIMNTETYPKDAYTTIHQLLENPRIVGDFVWTAWDYFGETGIGHHCLGEEHDGFMLLKYPYHIANCGDIDICGYRKPQSYYREISWGLRKAPYITARSPKSTGITHNPGLWGFYDCEHSWCWDGYEGMPIEVYAFGECDEMSLVLNGKEVGRASKTGNGVFVFTVIYEKGELCAIAYVNGKETGRSYIKTEGKSHQICAYVEDSHFTEKEKQEIYYVNIEIQDENGLLCTKAQERIFVKTEGAEILGTGSGDLTTEDVYAENTCIAHGGKALCIIKKSDGVDNVTVEITADGIKAKKIIL